MDFQNPECHVDYFACCITSLNHERIISGFLRIFWGLDPNPLQASWLSIYNLVARRRTVFFHCCIVVNMWQKHILFHIGTMWKKVWGQKENIEMDMFYIMCLGLDLMGVEEEALCCQRSPQMEQHVLGSVQHRGRGHIVVCVSGKQVASIWRQLLLGFHWQKLPSKFKKIYAEFESLMVNGRRVFLLCITWIHCEFLRFPHFMCPCSTFRSLLSFYIADKNKCVWLINYTSREPILRKCMPHVKSIWEMQKMSFLFTFGRLCALASNAVMHYSYRILAMQLVEISLKMHQQENERILDRIQVLFSSHTYR